MNLIGFASRQLDNNYSTRGYTGVCAFFFFWQTNVVENKPDLHAILHVPFTITNNKNGCRWFNVNYLSAMLIVSEMPF